LFILELILMDGGLAAALAKGLRVEAPYLKETLKLWRAAQKKLPAQADHTEIYKYLRKLRRR
jgi:3-hydroxyisobutyrate dehydrogenase-like beta-hydroxyacid dehydrogenase